MCTFCIVTVNMLFVWYAEVANKAAAGAQGDVQEPWNNALIKNVFYHLSSNFSYNGLHATLLLYCQARPCDTELFLSFASHRFCPLAACIHVLLCSRPRQLAYK